MKKAKIKNSLWIPIGIIVLLVLIMAWRYLMYGAPHEFLCGEYKGTFEGDFDFTLELVQGLRKWKALPLWSQIYSGPAFVFTSNLHVLGQAFLYFFTHNLGLSIKIYQVIFFMLSGIGMFLLANYISNNWITSLFSSMLYMFTPFFIGEMLAFIHYTTTYFCLPFAYFFIFKALDSKDRYVYYSLISAPIITLNLIAHPQNVFIGGFFYFLFAAAILLYRLFKMSSKFNNALYKMQFIKAVKIFFLIAVLVLLLASFYLLPTLLNGYPYTRSLDPGTGSWLKSLNKLPDAHSHYHSQSLIAGLTLFHWAWFIAPLKSMKYPPLIFMFIYALPFVLAIWGVLGGLKGGMKKHIWLLVFLGLASFLLSMGTRLRYFDLFTFAHRFIPYFHMARAPYRYFYQAALTICLLAGLGLSRLRKKASVILCAVLIIPYLYAANYYASDYNWTFRPSEEPHYLSQVQGWLKDNNKLRHLVIECCGIPTYLIINQRMLPCGLDFLTKNLYKDYLGRILSLFGFKYVLTPSLHCRRHLTFDRIGYMIPRADDGRDDLEDEEEYYSALTTEYLFVYERLKQDPNFKLYTAGTKDVAIFENKAAFDNYRIYPAKGIMILGGMNAYDFLNLDRFKDYFEPGKKMRVAPIFIAQSANLKEIYRIKKAAGELIMHNTDAIDLFFLLNQRYLILLSNLNNKGWYFFSQSFGVLQPFPYLDHSIGNFVFGDVSFSDFSIYAYNKNTVCRVPIAVKKEDSYRIMLRIYGGQDTGRLAAYLDGQYLGTLAVSGFNGFRWIEVARQNLKVGNYTLELALEEDKPVCLDAVSVIPGPQFEHGLNAVIKEFDELPITQIIGQQNIMQKGSSATTDLYIGEDAKYDIALRLFPASEDAAKEGKFNMVIDSKVIPVNYNLSRNNRLNIILDGIFISRGRRAVAFENIPGHIKIDFIAISASGNRKNELLNDNALIDYVQDAPDGYGGTIEFDRPLFLVHNETNYTGWRIELGNKAYRPIITNMFRNGFILDKPGRIKFRVLYSNFLQKLGIVISLFTLLLIALFIFLGFFRSRKIKKA